jgi:hypothetical protein
VLYMATQVTLMCTELNDQEPKAERKRMNGSPYIKYPKRLKQALVLEVKTEGPLGCYSWKRP